MNRTFLIVYIFSITTLYCSCTAQEDFNKEKVRDEVKQMMKEYFNAVKKGGLTAEFDYLDHSEDFFWVPPGYGSALTYDSVHTILTHNASSYQAVEFQWKTLKIIPLNHKLASYTGIVLSKMVDTTGKINEFELLETGLVIKRKEGWKLLNGQSRINNY